MGETPKAETNAFKTWSYLYSFSFEGIIFHRVNDCNGFIESNTVVERLLKRISSIKTTEDHILQMYNQLIKKLEIDRD